MKEVLDLLKERNQRDYQSFELLGDYYVNLFEPKKAMNAYKKSLKLNMTSKIKQKIASTYLKLNKPEKA